MVDKLPVLLHVPVAGSYNSARLVLLSDPQTRILPLRSRVAVCPRRPTDMLPVAVHVPVLGSYNSAVAVPWPPPPAKSTFPFRRRVAVPKAWGAVVLPVGFQAPVAGSYSSELVRKLAPTTPTTRTVPLERRITLGEWRAVANEPVELNVNGPPAMAALAIVAVR